MPRVSARRAATRTEPSTQAAPAAVARPRMVQQLPRPTWLRRLLRPAASRLITAVDAAVLGLLVLAVPAHRSGLAAFALVAFTLLRLLGLQRARLSLSVLDDLPMLAIALLAATGLTATLEVAANESGLSALMPWLVTAGVAVVAGRVVSYAVVRCARGRGLVSHPTVVIGCGVIGGQLTRALLDNPRYGLRPVGFLDDEPLLPEQERPVPLLSSPDRLAEVIVDNDIHDVIVAFSSRNELDTIELLRTCDRLGVEIFTIPRLFEVHSSRNNETVRGMPLVRLRRPTFRSSSWHLKRGVDVVVSALALLVLSPVLAVCALAVRREGGPGVIFRQQRVGIDGKTFDLLKFRSLKPASDSESATNWNIANDDRMGPVGRLMRRLSLDELPQLWNILKGDMSLVGPRPERPYFVDQFTLEHREYLHRHRVPCGLTGWAQVNGLRGDTSIGERARFDNYYIENWSLWLDVKIVLRTFAQVLRMAGG
jgi:exopolysaccharide biosynthesis polyprenyl glycosylphosphotransferase